VFSSSLTRKNKADLEDITTALTLSEDGKKDVLVKCIRDHLNANVKLTNNEHFACLFASLACSQKHAAEDGLKLISNSSQWCCVSPSSNLHVVHSPSHHDEPMSQLSS